ncbi:MAG: glycosyltransferase family 4 protein [Rhodospirillales bacterium]
MRIFLHDFSGHPPQVRLSRELACRGHEVMHSYAGDFLTPHGSLERQSDDPAGFAVRPISLGKPFVKSASLTRQMQELEYGRRLRRAMDTFAPDVVVLANTPPASLEFARRGCRRRGIPFVYWLMDINSIGMRTILTKKLGVAGRLIGWGYRLLERRQLDGSDKIVAICEEFRDTLAEWGIDGNKIAVMPLWAPLDEVPLRPKANEWSRRHGLDQTTNVLYAGTLGRKHDPSGLSALARHYREREEVRIVVVSEGDGVRRIAGEQAADGLSNIVLLPFQPFDALPDVLATADVFIGLLDDDAGGYCVPSKILTYLCAGRPQVGAMPETNRSAEVIRESGGGLVVPPAAPDALIAAVDGLVGDPMQRKRLGDAARAYAEREFDIRRLGDQFDGYLREACDASTATRLRTG